MDMWHSRGLGHRSLPALWHQPQDAGEPGLGDTRHVPKSVQVHNAYLYESIQDHRGRGLGLVRPRAARGAPPTPSTDQPSLRAYATQRVESQRQMHDVIEATTEVDRLLWEAQLACASHEYILAAALYRRAACLGSALACAYLAKLFGFGVVRAHQSVFLFERDAMRGLAWALVAWQRLLPSLGAETDDAPLPSTQWSLLSQTLALLCTLLCSQEVGQSLLLDEAHASLSLSLLLHFPRSCELGRDRVQRTNALPLSEEPGSIWSAMHETWERSTDLFTPHADPDDSVDTLDTSQTLAQVHLAFVYAFLTLRTACAARSAASLANVHDAWSHYLLATEMVADKTPLMRYRCVAMEAKQWSAPSEKSPDARLEREEVLALSAKFASFFPFATPRPRLSTSVPALPDSFRQPSAPASASTSTKRFNTARPAVFTQTPRPMALAPSGEFASVQGSREFSGASTSSLRLMEQRQARSRSTSRSTVQGQQQPSWASAAEEPAYLARMNDPVPGRRRRRTSSVVSISPSLLCPSVGASASHTPLAPQQATATQGPSTSEGVHAANPQRTSSYPALRTRLERQASAASLRG